MGKTLYFDCFSGASGDMVLGALLDLGLPIDALGGALGSLAIDHGAISAERVLRAGVAATRFRLEEPEHTHVHAGFEQPPALAHDGDDRGHATHDHGHGRRHDHGDDHDHGHPHGPGQGHSHATGHGHHSLADIQLYIDRSGLSPEGKSRAAAMFRRLAEAEAAIHDMPLDRIHLHEVGAVDSIVDIVGAVFGMEWLGATDIVASPLNVGSGTVRCAHGVFPVPAPATVRLLQGVPIYSGAVAQELTTPTGALLVTSYAREFGPIPPMTVSRIGYGAGGRDVLEHPNVLRLLLGERNASDSAERIVTIECEIDDMNPQLFGPLMDRLYDAGALDVYYAPVQMKKNRPGTLVTVIAPPEKRHALSGVLFRDTTTIGVRYQEMHRERLDREIRTVATPVGPIRFKIARRGGSIVNASPEFEDCARAAAERQMPIKDVQALAVRAWLEQAESH
ncbi:MAG: nickel pincer cofactor biosynthesis protein LarC [Vicinamibacterales bacterium]